MASQSSSQSQPEGSTASLLPPIPRATSIIVIGMAGSGKSTFTASLAAHQTQKATESPESPAPAPYMVNLDPAVGTLGYEPNVDVRDTVDYARVMEQ